MSSPQRFQHSSPVLGDKVKRKRSQFTYKNLAQLANSSTSCPLRVIAHIDLDAFYAQCEMVRLGLDREKPLAVQQWQGLIAINYPARKHGLTRHITPVEAKKLCPNLICQHVATWREGDAKWQYHEDAASQIATHKVSLDPYRLESRRILQCIKEALPADLQKVEKASIDEVFLDLSSHVHSIMLERYPELSLPALYDDITENLPMPPTTALDWVADALVDLNPEETEDDDPDWDDIAILIASEITRDVRARIFEKLEYTCSAGIAQNKMLSKLGSAHRKPDQQTVVRNRAVQKFLSDFKFTKIRGMGGKLGDSVLNVFNTDTVSGLLQFTIDQLKSKLDDGTASWIYNVIRGVDLSEVNPGTQIKSMLSAKSFRPSINAFEQGVRWIRIFVADIYSRLLEEGVLENKRRPKVITCHVRHGADTKSRQTPIPLGKTITEAVLFDLAKTLLNQVIAEGNVWPCSNISLSVGGFEDGVVGNRLISQFLVKGAEAKTFKETSGESSTERPSKRPRTGDKGIFIFLTKNDSLEEHDDGQDLNNDDLDHEALDTVIENKQDEVHANPEPDSSRAEQSPFKRFTCERCNKHLTGGQELQNHNDWHFAKDLQDEDRSQSTNALRSGQLQKHSQNLTRPGSTKISSSARGEKKVEKGQRKLNFGT